MFFAAFTLGLLVSSVFSLRAERHIPWTGMPPEQVSGIAFTAAADSRKISSGGYLLEAELHEVHAAGGGLADAGGNLLCFFNTDPKIYRGEKLFSASELRVSPELHLVYENQSLGNLSMLREPLYLTSFIDPAELVRSGQSSCLSDLRAEVSRKIERRCMDLGDEAGGLLLALLTGNRDGLSAEENRIFREAGCSHILALSGMHLGILSALILLILKPLPGRMPAFIISSVIVFGYLILTGFGISLVRAAVMYFLFGLSHAFYRKVSSFDILLLSFIILCAAVPASFYTLSFQLSFLAVAGILTAAPEINLLLKPWFPAALRLPLSISAGAQMFVIPLLLQIFGVIYPIGLIAGLVIAPMVTLFIWSGLFFLITGLTAVSLFSDLIYKAICYTAGAASEMPSVSVENSSVWLVPFFSGLIIMLIICSIRRRMLNGISGKL